MPKLTKISKIEKAEPQSPSRETQTVSNETLPKRNYKFLSNRISSSHL